MAYLRTAHPGEPATRILLDGLAEEYARLYGEKTEGELSTREASDLIPPRGALLLLVYGSDTLAGGGVAPLAEGVAEIKRMWTAPAHRGRGHARRILAALERQALALGYHTVRLQTGVVAEPAVALYRSAGYEEIPPFGAYRDEPLAVGFEKALVTDPEVAIPVRTAPQVRPEVAA